MAKILIVSDTHGDDTWLNVLNTKQYDYIIHAGDHLLPESEISDITNYYVDGNNDWGQKNIDIFEIESIKFILVHGDEQNIYTYNKSDWILPLLKLARKHNAQFLIFGHTHIPIIEKYEGITFINPGSMHFSRHNGSKAYAELLLNNGEFFVDFYELSKK